MFFEELENKLDELLVAHGALIIAEINDSRCQGQSDRQHRREREEKYEKLKEEYRTLLGKTLARNSLNPDINSVA